MQNELVFFEPSKDTTVTTFISKPYGPCDPIPRKRVLV